VRSREAWRSFLERRYSPRLHMSLILAASGFVSMVVSWAMLAGGVDSMLVRYPVAISFSYGMFLLGVWIWLQLMGLREGLGILDGPSGDVGGYNTGRIVTDARGGGGTFDGGGASTAWAESESAVPARIVSASPRSGSGSGSGFSFDLDGDGLVLVLLALALVAAVFFCSGYLVFYAPDVLAEAAFGAALTGTLAKTAAKQSRDGWVSGVVRKTWWPYAVILVLALAFAGFAAHHFPQAKTFKQAVAMAAQPKER